MKDTTRDIIDFRAQIPANKFNPPRLAENRVLIRSSLFERHLGATPPQYIILEAQAGQGKTTAAIQFVSRLDTPCIWYQITKEDRDPLFLFSALLEGVRHTLPGFSCPRLEVLLQQAELIQGDIARPVNLILAALKRAMPGGCIFVFDDLQLIADAEQSLGVVDYMLETAPQDLSFILISRKPLSFSSKQLRYGSSTLYLGNGDLAFTEMETRGLLEILQESSPDPQVVSELSSRTGGWVMGLVLAASRKRGRDAITASSPEIIDDHLASYFEEELYDRLDESRQRILIKLALLDDIDVDLAGEITGYGEVKKLLLNLMDENFFIRSLNTDASLFSIHHLFLCLLRKKAGELLSREESQAVLLQAASSSLGRGILGQGFKYLLRAEAFGELEELLSHRGMEMVFMNRLMTLGDILKEIPSDRIQNSAWFTLFSAFVVQKTNPAESLELFQRARQLFQKLDNQHGELVALGELIYYHVLLSPDYNRCNSYLQNANRLFEQCGKELPSFCQANTAKNIGVGFFYFLNDLTTAIAYLRTAEIEAEKIASPSQLLEIMASQGLVHLYHGAFKQAEAMAERIHRIMAEKDCGLRGLLAGNYFLLQILHLKGDYEGYHRLKQGILQKLDPRILNGTILQAFITLYDISIATAEGDLDKALSLIDTHAESGFFVVVKHLRNEMLATKALLLSQKGDFDTEGQAIVRELLPAMEGSTMSGYRLKLLIPVALTLVRERAFEHGRQLIDREVELSRKSVPLFETYGRLLRAFGATLDGNRETVRADLEYGLGDMQRQGYYHIRCFSPVELRALLSLAIELDVYPAFARMLAAEYLNVGLNDDGSETPLLSITTLGDFVLSIGGDVVGRASDFTVTQRQLLGLLISHPQMEISQEQAQFELWPDSTPAKGRNRFDALLSRLRKVLSGVLKGYPVKEYLVLEKGLLSLQNCRIDARLFSDAVQRGMKLGKNQQWWQAGNRFMSALVLWSGPFVSDLLPGEQSSDYGWELQGKLVELGTFWCQELAESSQLGKAVEVASKIWKESPDNEQIASLLYSLFVRNKEPLQAKRLYTYYEELLHKHGYPEEEIREMMYQLVSAGK